MGKSAGDLKYKTEDQTFESLFLGFLIEVLLYFQVLKRLYFSKLFHLDSLLKKYQENHLHLEHCYVIYFCPCRDFLSILLPWSCCVLTESLLVAALGCIFTQQVTLV